MISKISYWTFPAKGRQVLNIQTFGSPELMQIEVPNEQYKRLLWMALDMYFKESFTPVPTPTQPTESAT